MNGVIGIKQSMTQLFLPDGSVAPVTALMVPVCTVTQIKTKGHDGYSAVQMGVVPLKKARSTLQGKQFRYITEFRVTEDVASHCKVGQVLEEIPLKPGDMVTVTSTSKGKGFAGVVKRHHFRGHPTTHGHKDQARASGSIGHGVQHVVKGTRMAGRMGGDRVTIKNLKVVAVHQKAREILINGSMAGARNALVFIKRLDQEVL